MLFPLLSVSSSELLVLSSPRVPWIKRPPEGLWLSTITLAQPINSVALGVGISWLDSWGPRPNLAAQSQSMPMTTVTTHDGASSESTYGDAHALASGENLQRFLVKDLSF
ncbi:hypothetical protein BDV34DRAFT_32142 [Aspergillus parasiticus]|uniref:Uncharacterized protein n=1 Tax=Aspergillus parasiticus TaxID=5067 RepID=A0A5N6DYF7_ASPPA|nr:hypothetical protein BDV34DRAFT_32142 [Aspergillus parasiticus]